MKTIWNIKQVEPRRGCGMRRGLSQRGCCARRDGTDGRTGRGGFPEPPGRQRPPLHPCPRTGPAITPAGGTQRKRSELPARRPGAAQPRNRRAPHMRRQEAPLAEAASRSGETRLPPCTSGGHWSACRSRGRRLAGANRRWERLAGGKRRFFPLRRWGEVRGAAPRRARGLRCQAAARCRGAGLAERLGFFPPTNRTLGGDASGCLCVEGGGLLHRKGGTWTGFMFSSLACLTRQETTELWGDGKGFSSCLGKSNLKKHSIFVFSVLFRSTELTRVCSFALQRLISLF